jgi:hypothetical protein
MTSTGRILAGIADSQMQDVFHDLVDEGQGTPDPDVWEIDEFLTHQIEFIEANPDLTPKRKASIVARLREALGNDLPGPVYYACQRIVDRAQAARHGLDAYLDNVARDMGETRADLQRAMTDLLEADRASATPTRASTKFETEFRARAESAHLPLDRATLKAIEQIEARRAATLALQPTRATVHLEPVDSPTFAAIGYNPAVGHMEIEFQARPGRTYGYRIPPEAYAEFRKAADPEAYYQSRIRGNPDYTYERPEDWTAARILRRCPTCGEFTPLHGHSCAVRGSNEEQSRTVRLARAAILGEPPETPDHHRLGTPARRGHYTNPDSTVSTTPLREVQTAARQHTRVSIPLTGVGTDTDGTQHTMTGRVIIDYLGPRKGYYVTAVVAPGDSGDDQLRCTCPDYQATYTCRHVRAAVADLANRVNSTAVKDPDNVDAARRTDPDALNPGNTAAPARVHWNSPESLWSANPARYDDAAIDAITRKKAGLEPVPYRYTDATAGMGARDTGRPFGIEIEFDFPQGMSDDDREQALTRIGRALYRMELTGTTRQEEYEEQKERGYRDQHERGWAFKKDLTCAGEITSPIMWDEADTWTNLRRVCETVQRYGGVPSVRTGFHVHVSAGDFSTSPHAHTRLLATMTEHEDVLYRIAADPSRGTHRGTEHCARNLTPAAGFTPITEARLAQDGDRDVAVNFAAVNGRPDDHVEFRLWDGTLDPAVMQQQIVASLAITQDAVRGQGTGTTGSHGASLGEHARSAQLGRAVTDDTDGYRAFLDRVLWRDQEKRSLTALFALSAWQDRPNRTEAGPAA